MINRPKGSGPHAISAAAHLRLPRRKKTAKASLHKKAKPAKALLRRRSPAKSLTERMKLAKEAGLDGTNHRIVERGDK